MAKSKTPGEILEAISEVFKEDLGALDAKVKLADTLTRRIGETCDAVLVQNVEFASGSVLVSGLLRALAEVIITESEVRTPERRINLAEVRSNLHVAWDALEHYVAGGVSAAEEAGVVIVISRQKGSDRVQGTTPPARPTPPAPPAYDRDRDNPLPDRADHVPENTFSGSRSSGTEG